MSYSGVKVLQVIETPTGRNEDPKNLKNYNMSKNSSYKLGYRAVVQKRVYIYIWKESCFQVLKTPSRFNRQNFDSPKLFFFPIFIRCFPLLSTLEDTIGPEGWVNSLWPKKADKGTLEPTGVLRGFRSVRSQVWSRRWGRETMSRDTLSFRGCLEMGRIRLEAGLCEIYKRVTFACDFFEETMIIVAQSNCPCSCVVNKNKWMEGN